MVLERKRKCFLLIFTMRHRLLPSETFVGLRCQQGTGTRTAAVQGGLDSRFDCFLLPL
ncbi:predicted protein [Plenodomus lingam JN3]|uniref:Predicted protein n=1 Tax=Leptosphaeria maculans (strain JN3 / isolate v23.1.3 / race Av1-4-5-6-7-8) TaxID=985895 RepID=E4ZRC2_LEPMJ|nr:predicted protein [Plenodomus lingam JN3]CBX93787.1 predicted protein [Plenodomus lingam JN3]